MDSEHYVDSPYVAELVLICEMPAVPRCQKVTTMKGGDGEVERVTFGVEGHHVVAHVRVNNFHHGLADP